jgi:Uma2 family endonuclease
MRGVVGREEGVTLTAEMRVDERYLKFVRKLITSHRWTSADYESIPEEIQCEIYDGGLHVAPSGTAGHQNATDDLAALLRQFVAHRWLVVTDVDAEIGDQIFRPDVVVMRELFDGRPVPAANIHVVVEIISLNENVERTIKKAAYAAAGIPAYIIVDGKQGERIAEIYHLKGDGYALVALVPQDGRLTLTRPFTYVIDMNKINK